MESRKRGEKLKGRAEKQDGEQDRLILTKSQMLAPVCDALPAQRPNWAWRDVTLILGALLASEAVTPRQKRPLPSRGLQSHRNTEAALPMTRCAGGESSSCCEARRWGSWASLGNLEEPS